MSHRDVPGLTRKQRERRRKLRGQWARRRKLAGEWHGGRVAPADSDMACARASAFGSVRMCDYLAEQGVVGFRDARASGKVVDRAREKCLSAFYHQAYKGEVDSVVVASAVEAYVEDKFERRVDTTCCLLHAARLAGFKFRSTRGGVRVASIGGGPGNDATGFVVYTQQQPASHSLPTPTHIDITVFDFCASWAPIVHSVSNALKAYESLHTQTNAGRIGRDEARPNKISSDAGTAKAKVTLDFQLADLKADKSSTINEALLEAVPRTDVFLFSNVCHETRAWEHTMLPEILQSASPGALFLFVDLWRKDLKLSRCIQTHCCRRLQGRVLGTSHFSIQRWPQARPFGLNFKGLQWRLPSGLIT